MLTTPHNSAPQPDSQPLPNQRCSRGVSSSALIFDNITTSLP
jgi:hypothetical protein